MANDVGGAYNSALKAVTVDEYKPAKGKSAKPDKKTFSQRMEEHAINYAKRRKDTSKDINPIIRWLAVPLGGVYDRYMAGKAGIWTEGLSKLESKLYGAGFWTWELIKDSAVAYGAYKYIENKYLK